MEQPPVLPPAAATRAAPPAIEVANGQFAWGLQQQEGQEQGGQGQAGGEDTPLAQQAQEPEVLLHDVNLTGAAGCSPGPTYMLPLGAHAEGAGLRVGLSSVSAVRLPSCLRMSCLAVALPCLQCRGGSC